MIKTISIKIVGNLLQFIVISVVCTSLVASSTGDDSELSHGSRDSRVLFKATIAPTLCRGEDDIETGVCKPRKSCTRNNGTNLGGSCGTYGAGICCLPVVVPTMNGVPIVVNERVAALRGNRNFEDNYFLLPRMNGSCQIKLDFKSFPFKGPTNGMCMEDQFWVTGSITVKSLNLCGPMTQPLYLSYGSSEGIRLNFRSAAKTGFEVKIQHVDCNSISKVDDHCLLSYNMPMGEIHSFGYGGALNGNQINGLEYTICVGGKSPTKSTFNWEMCQTSGTQPKDFPTTTMFTFNSFYTTNVFGPYGGVGIACHDKVSHVSVPGIGVFCGGYFPNITKATSNQLMVKTMMDDKDRLMAQPLDSYNPIIMNKLWDPPETCENDVAPGPGLLTMYNECGMSRPQVGTEYQCVCSRNILPARMLPTFNVFGFCLKYTTVQTEDAG